MGLSGSSLMSDLHLSARKIGRRLSGRRRLDLAIEHDGDRCGGMSRILVGPWRRSVPHPTPPAWDGGDVCPLDTVVLNDWTGLSSPRPPPDKVMVPIAE